MGTSYNSNIVTDGLVLCLDAANPRSFPTSGNKWYDLSGNGYTIDGLAGNMSYGNFSNGYCDFDGSNEYMQTNFNLTNKIGITFAFWVRFDYLVTNGYYIILDNSTGSSGFGLRAFGSTYQAFAYNSSSTALINDSHTLTTNKWYYIANIFDTNAITVYVNMSKATASGGNGLNIVKQDFTNNMRVGCTADALGSYLNGQIAQIMAYDKILSEQEIRQNYNATRGRYGY